jgi:ornithine cyclodeaminase
VTNYDLVGERSAALCARLQQQGCRADRTDYPEDAIRGADLVLFATTAPKPYLEDPALFTPKQSVLHLSLRDLGVAVILSADNFVDDIEHCTQAHTSVHLAEIATGNRTFIAGTLGDLITHSVTLHQSRVRIFSPFGLGMLDLILARFVFEQAVANGQTIPIEDFFAQARPAC